MRVNLIISASFLLLGCREKEIEKKITAQPIGRPPANVVIKPPVETTKPRKPLEKKKKETEKKPPGFFGRIFGWQDKKSDEVVSSRGPKTQVEEDPPVDFAGWTGKSADLWNEKLEESTAAKDNHVGSDLKKPVGESFSEVATQDGKEISVKSAQIISSSSLTSESRVFAGDDERVIKYRSTPSAAEENLLVRNHAFMGLIHEMTTQEGLAPIVPEPLYLSGETIYDVETHESDRSLLEPEEDIQAMDGRGVIYQVMQQGGVSLRVWTGSQTGSGANVKKADVLMLGKNLITQLKALHSMGIVHGDIQWDNVILKNPSDFSADSDVLLIDFDRSYHIDLEKSKPTDSRGIASGSMGFDLFRAYNVMRALVDGNDLSSQEGSLARGEVTLVETGNKKLNSRLQSLFAECAKLKNHQQAEILNKEAQILKVIDEMVNQSAA